MILLWLRGPSFILFFFFNDTATTEIYTLSLHDALPICRSARHDDARRCGKPAAAPRTGRGRRAGQQDRKSTRLNSSHLVISYAVFCLKKKKEAVCQADDQHVTLLNKAQTVVNPTLAHTL